MRPDLSADLPALQVRRNRIVTRHSGEVVRLRGVNRSGLEYAEPYSDNGFLSVACLTEDDMRELVQGWGARVVRLPFNQSFALEGRGVRSAEDYLRAIDQVIAWSAQYGAYTLLDLQWLDADTPRGWNRDGTINRVPPLPDEGSIEVWARLARRYRNEPAVLFDLFNEPHDPLFDDLTPLEGVGPDGRTWRLPGRRVTMLEWQSWATHLIDVIRAERPESLIFVSGVAWAFDLRGFPLRTRDGVPIANIVYSTHVYPWSKTGLLKSGTLEGRWWQAFAHLAAEVPVFAGEWGGGDDDLEWGRRLAAYFDGLEMGWAAWSWADWPGLVCDCRTCDYTPTAFGSLVRAQLTPASNAA